MGGMEEFSKCPVISVDSGQDNWLQLENTLYWISSLATNIIILRC